MASPILHPLVLSSSHNIPTSYVGNYLSSCEQLIFFVVRNHVSLGSPNHTRIPGLTEEFSVCTSGTLKEERGECRPSPTQKCCVGINFVSPGQRHVGKMCQHLAVGPTCRRHVGNNASRGIPHRPNFTQNMQPIKRCRRSLAHLNRTTPEYPDVDNGVAAGRPWLFCFIPPIAFVGGMWWIQVGGGHQYSAIFYEVE